MRTITRTCGLLLLAAAAAHGQTTWYVDAAAPGPGAGTAASPFVAIQPALQACVGLDTILVAPGTYTENLDFLGKEVILRSTGGANLTIVDGAQGGPVVRITALEGPATRIEGFTLTNGLAAHGGGLLIGAGAAPVVLACHITANGASLGGGGVNVADATATFEDCELAANTAESGGGLRCAGATLVMRRCRVVDNTASGPGGGVHVTNHATATLEACTIRGNSSPYAGGGLAVHNFSTASVVNGVIVQNLAATGMGGGVTIEKWSSAALRSTTVAHNGALIGGGLRTTGGGTLEHAIVWGNVPDSIERSGGSAPAVSWSTIDGGWPGTGNLGQDPLFVDPAGGDFHLRRFSPCVDAGDPSSVGLPPHDVDGDPRILHGRVDQGADEVAALALEVDQPAGPASLTVRRIAWAHPGAGVFSAFTLEVANGGGALGTGPWGGVHISALDVWTQFTSGTAPFVQTLDALGEVSWNAAPGTVVGATGLVVYGVTVVYVPGTLQPLAWTPPIAYTFL